MVLKEGWGTADNQKYELQNSIFMAAAKLFVSNFSTSFLSLIKKEAASKKVIIQQNFAEAVYRYAFSEKGEHLLAAWMLADLEVLSLGQGRNQPPALT